MVFTASDLQPLFECCSVGSLCAALQLEGEGVCTHSAPIVILYIIRYGPVNDSLGLRIASAIPIPTFIFKSFFIFTPYPLQGPFLSLLLIGKPPRPLKL